MSLATAIVLLSLQGPAPSLPEVDNYVADRMRSHLVPGLAVVIIRNGEVVHRRGFGDLDATRPLILGSLSKAITATAVLQLVDGGQVDLDAPAQRYLGDFRFSDPDVAAVTVRQLLNQNGGIPSSAPRAGRRAATLAEHVEALRDVRLVAQPGEGHIYSSPNYQILGRIVEIVSGQTFGEYVTDRIFAPLGMTSSFVDGGATSGGVAPGRSLWWGVAGPSPYRFEPGRLPTASIIASADDLSRFALSHLGVGLQLLTPASLALAHDGAAEADGFSYAMGWRVGPTAGVPSLWHGGAVPSYRGAVVLLPASQSAVIVLTNVSSMFGDHTREIATGVVAILEQRPLPEEPRSLRSVYLVIAALSILLITVQVRALARAIRGKVQSPRPSAVILFDLVLPLAALIIMPRLTRISHRGMWESAPDIVTTVVVLVLLGAITGLVKLCGRPRLAAKAPPRPGGGQSWRA